MGKRITLSRPRMESLAEESFDRTEVFAPVLRVLDPGDFFADDVRVTVDDVVTSVVVETVSTGVADCVAVEAAVAVSAADCAGRLQAAANATAAKAPASDSCLVIDRFPE
jgi:hypothetical protein